MTACKKYFGRLIVLCFVIGLLAAACDSPKRVSQATDATTSVQPPAAGGYCWSTTGESVGNAAGGAVKQIATNSPSGCCGLCARETDRSQQAETACADCQACAAGDSSECQCPDNQTATTATPPGSGASESETPPDDSARQSEPPKTHAQDRDLFHFLLTNKDRITRQVQLLENGVETLTESDDPEITARIQEHVASMHERVEHARPIRMRDPLFREIFAHAGQIEMQLENTPGGIRVREVSADPYVVQLIQAHSKVVTGFVERGFEEARQNHEPPAR